MNKKIEKNESTESIELEKNINTKRVNYNSEIIIGKSAVGNNTSGYHPHIYNEYNQTALLGMKEQLKNHSQCVKICTFSRNNYGNNGEKCIKDLKRLLGNVCIKNIECPILKTTNFDNLLILLIKIVEFLYCIRTKYSNQYDRIILYTISKINLEELGISLEELSCIEFPGDGTYIKGFPHDLAAYLKIIIKLSKNNIIKNNFLEQYKNFCNDFQPWSRTLVTFLNTYASHLLEMMFEIDSLPNITKINSYGIFVRNKDLNITKFDEFIESHNSLAQLSII